MFMSERDPWCFLAVPGHEKRLRYFLAVPDG